MIYKNLLKKKYSTLRKKKYSKHDIPTKNQSSIKPNLVEENFSYTQITQGKAKKNN